MVQGLGGSRTQSSPAFSWEIGTCHPSSTSNVFNQEAPLSFSVQFLLCGYNRLNHEPSDLLQFAALLPTLEMGQG